MRFTTALWRYEGDAGWHVLTVPPAESDDVRDTAGTRRGFGSVRVRVTVGATSWQTSVFPSKDGTYVLPVKQAVRRAEGLEDGDPVDVELELR